MARTIKVNTSNNKSWLFSTKEEATAFLEELVKVKPWVGLQLSAWNQTRSWLHTAMYLNHTEFHTPPKKMYQYIYPDAKLCVLLEEEMPFCRHCGSRMTGEKSGPKNFMLSSFPPQAHVHCTNMECSTRSHTTYRVW